MNTATTPRIATFPARLRMATLTAGALVALLLACSSAMPLAARAAPSGKVSAAAAAAKGGGSEGGVSGLEKAASDAGKTGENVAMSLIGLALAIAAIILAFRRDFKEAAGVLAIGVVAIFLADKGIGVKVISETVEKLFKAS